MSFRKGIFLLIFLLLVIHNWADAKAYIKDIKLETDDLQHKVTVFYDGAFKGKPELTVKDSTIQVVLADAIAWPKIEKQISLNGVPNDTMLTAYQYNSNLVRVRTILPFSALEYEGKINLQEKNGQLSFLFPKKQASAASVKTDYDNGLLEKLLQDKKIKEIEQQQEVRKDDKKVIVEDKVKTVLSSNDKKALDLPTNGSEKKGFSLSGYIGKFVAFLGIILLGFYGIMGLFRKGILKKGKLGFLNNTEVVTVLNTTYIAPKKSILMVKVHNQIMLLGSDERGLHYLTEIKDTTGLLKDGERAVAGDNFDTSLIMAEEQKKEFTMKEVNTPNKENGPSLTDFLTDADTAKVQERVKLSDQIKRKVKDLKPLQ